MSVFLQFLRSVVFLSRHATPQNRESGEYAFHIGKILRMMEQHREHNFTLEELAAHAQMSVSNFRHQFIKITGSSPINYLIRLRLKKSVALLVTPIDISHAAAQCGFSDSNYLARQFRKYLGMSPGEFKHRYGRNEITIQEAIDLINGI